MRTPWADTPFFEPPRRNAYSHPASPRARPCTAEQGGRAQRERYALRAAHVRGGHYTRNARSTVHCRLYFGTPVHDLLMIFHCPSVLSSTT